MKRRNERENGTTRDFLTLGSIELKQVVAARFNVQRYRFADRAIHTALVWWICNLYTCTDLMVLSLSEAGKRNKGSREIDDRKVVCGF